jgi:primosomal protein N' (replication factor Y)
MTKQQNLFEVEPQPWNIDDQDDWLAARVALAEAPFGPYDYRIPSEFESSVRAGVRLKVPLGRGNRTMQGYCVDVIGPFHPQAHTVNPGKLKTIIGVLDAAPIINLQLLELAAWISDYYICPIGTVIEAIVPPGIRNRSGTRELMFLSLAPDVSRRLETMKLPAKQKSILATLAVGGDDWTAQELAETVGCTQAPINALRNKGLIVSTNRRVRTLSHEIQQENRQENLILNPDQQRALDRICESIDANEFRCFLMHGITGSGKTEVYIRAIQKIVEYGRQAIVLVPEISLTPQTRQRFRARFDHVAVLHSHLTAAQRAWHWNEIANGNVQVIIGARSAVFAPAPNLGLIVIDEEHDGSFKQDNAPRYHARDVAVWRGIRSRIPMVLGTATPAVETWQKSRTGEYELISLPHRVNDLPLPDVATIDLRIDFGSKSNQGALSQKLRQEIRAAIQAGGQVILLLNRRGFSTRIQCPACGNVEYCPDCSIPLTHHTEGNKAVCHYCDYQMPAPNHCSKCGFAAIRFSGIGTQKLEREVQAIFPDVPCMRMDTDTMRRPGSHELALDKFRNGEIKILLGTQMIAKGLDFPNVTLVGVINADTALHFPDFRASERTFGLVTQVAGRSGRGAKGGRVLVQTFSPENPAIIAATKHDYLRFAEYELPLREQFGYPPFGAITRVVVRSEAEELAKQMADHIAQAIQQAADDLKFPLTILGPAKATVEKLRGKYRYHMLIRSAIGSEVQTVIRRAQLSIKTIDQVQWIVDIDPQDML